MNSNILILLIWNIVVMVIYGIDKWLAIAKKRRISESALLTCGFLFGGFGAIFGMILFNHKTSKMKFRILVPMMLIAEAIVLYKVL